MADPHAIGAEFMRWEIATSVAGALLGVNPFDEPNVQQAKDATRVLLARYESDGHLPAAAGAVRGADRADLTLSRAARTSLGGSPPESILSLLEERDYLSVLVYLHAEPSTADVLHRFRMAIRDTARVATMIGYGPRYLHSTGQLHKGGRSG
jgi:transaldolase/glucose-6-phosphate isomerase